MTELERQEKEQELRNQLNQLQDEKIRLKQPLVYDYLKDNGFSFENKNYICTASKQITDDFEILISFLTNIEIAFFYSNQKLGGTSFKPIYPKHFFEYRDANLVIEFLKNPVLPKKFKVTFHCEMEYFYTRGIEELREEVTHWHCSPNDLSVTVEEI